MTGYSSNVVTWTCQIIHNVKCSHWSIHPEALAVGKMPVELKSVLVAAISMLSIKQSSTYEIMFAQCALQRNGQ